MRIPTAADTPPPLMVPVRRLVAEGDPSTVETGGVKKRRRGKRAATAESHSWEQGPRSSRSGRTEKRQMLGMLIGGGALFALIVAGVIFLMNGGRPQVVEPAAKAAAVVTAGGRPVEAAVRSAFERDQVAVLAELETLARKFMEADTVEALVPLVRHPALTEARLRGFYPGGKVQAPGLSQFNTGGGLVITGKVATIEVLTRDHEARSLAFADTPQGVRVDWESWVGWSDISWQEFLASKPVSSHVFRVTLTAVDYYNFGFAEEAKWQSYRLESPDYEHAIFGYAERDSVLNARLRPDAETKSVALMLALKFPPGATSSSQVVIESQVAAGWVEDESQP